MAQPVRFLQDPSAPAGVGEFEFDDGSTLYAEHPELAMQLENAPAPAPMAANEIDPRERAHVAGLANAWSNPNIRQIADMVRAAPDAPPQAPAGPPPAASPPPRAMPVMAPPEGPPMGPQRPQVLDDEAKNYINSPVRVAGSPGVNPMRMRAEGVPVPKRVETVVKGSSPLPQFPQEMRDRAALADRNLTEAQDARMELETGLAYEEAARAKRAALQAEQDAAKKARELAVNEERYRAERSHLQQTIEKENAHEKVNPDHWFQSRGTFGQISLFLAQMLSGGIKASSGIDMGLDKTIDSAIENDIRLQENEIKQRRLSRNNRLADFTQMYGGDIERAKSALRIAQENAVAKQAAMFAASSRNQDVSARAREFVAARDVQRSQAEREFYAKAMGGGQEMTQTITEDVVQPKAATGGGMRAPTYEERLGRTERVAKSKSNIRTGERNVLDMPDPKDLDRPAARAEDRKQNAVITDYGEKKTKIDKARVKLNQLATAYGVAVDWQTGTVDVPKEWGGIRGHGIDRVIPTPLLNALPGKSAEDASSTRAIQDEAAQAYSHAVTGAGASDKERESHRRVVLGGVTDRDAVNALRRAVEGLNSEERSTESQYLPNVRDAYEENRQGVNIQRATPGPKVKAY